MLNEYQHALNNCEESGLNDETHTLPYSVTLPSTWSPPPQGYIKINVDGATRPTGPIATITRDQSGTFIEGSTKNFHRVTLKETEAWGFL